MPGSLKFIEKEGLRLFFNPAFSKHSRKPKKLKYHPSSGLPKHPSSQLRASLKLALGKSGPKSGLWGSLESWLPRKCWCWRRIPSPAWSVSHRGCQTDGTVHEENASFAIHQICNSTAALIFNMERSGNPRGEQRLSTLLRQSPKELFI